MPVEQQPRRGRRAGADINDPLLAVDDLSVEFTLRGVRSTVVEGVSYPVGRGEFVGIIGETGSGKSVSLRAGLHALPRNARVLRGTRVFDGRDMATMSSLKGSTTRKPLNVSVRRMRKPVKRSN